MSAVAGTRDAWRWIRRLGELLVVGSVVAAFAGCGGQPRVFSGVAHATVALINGSAADGNVRSSAFCGGVLMEDGGVVTAAHCVRDRALPDVLIGVDDLCGEVDAERRYSVTAIRVGSGSHRELAYLTLDRPIAAPVGVVVNDLEVDSLGYVAFGWGREVQGGMRPCETKMLRLENTGSTDGCALDIAAAGLADIERSLLCLRPVPRSMNTCQGDSGGGVYEIRTDARLQLAGITLGGSGCGPEDDGLYLSRELVEDFVANLR